MLWMISMSVCAQNSLTDKGKPAKHLYHVSVNGNDANNGDAATPFKSISAAANVAMPRDVITVHAGIHREQITPPRGGNSESERIVYQAAKGEKVDIRVSEIIKGWEKKDHDTWVVKIPNTFFGKFNPFDDLIRGDWYSGGPFHTGAVYLNGDWLMESLKKEAVSGFVMQHAATNWAPPTAEQMGLIGTELEWCCICT